MDSPNNYYPNKSIYIIHYPHGQKVEFSNGIIKMIFEDNFTIAHLCSTKEGSSGGPLINILNHKVIVLHKGGKEKKNFNLGTLLKIPIQEFNQKYYYKMNNNCQKNNNNFENHNINNNNNISFNISNANMNFNNSQNMNFNNMPFMDFNNNQNMNFNYFPFINFNNMHFMNFNNMPFMNFNNNQNMNYNPSQAQNMFQMNNQFNMLLSSDNFKKENLPKEKPFNLNEKTSENLFPYIKGERIEIIFVNSKNISKIVKIPKSLRKNDIYSIVGKYKSFKYSEITKLMHNNIILENDDSSIDCILNGDSIKIMEFLNCDTSYYDSLLLFAVQEKGYFCLFLMV